MNQRVAEARSRLDALYRRVATLGGDPELQAYWAQFLCVRTSGFIEDSVRTMFLNYARARSSQAVANYVSHNLDFFQNPKAEKLAELARAFDPAFEASFRAYVVDHRKDAIDSIVNLKNLVAHGRSVTVTYTRIAGYYSSALEVLVFVDELLQ